MRLFFGFDLDARDKAAIARWRDRCVSADGRAVAPASFHITLAFIGEVDAGRLERLCDCADDVLAERVPRSIPLDCDQFGYWPKPGICWLGSRAASPELAEIAGALARAGRVVGAPVDRHAFVPHVTLYRNCRQPPPAPLVEPRHHLELDTVTLFESRRERRGMHYQPVMSWRIALPADKDPATR